MSVTITPENFETVIANHKGPIVLDIYAPWCGPCQQMIPVVKAVEEELGERCLFAKLNVDEGHQIASHYEVSSVPTFIFLNNGVVMGKEVGYMNKTVLREKITRFLNL